MLHWAIRRRARSKSCLRDALAARADAISAYGYDANGNLATRNGATLGWTSYNLPAVLNASGYSATFSYTPDRRRWRQVSTYASGTETTIYVGEQMEKLTTPVRTHWKHRLPTPSGEVQVIRRSDGTTETLYLAADHLGSVDAVLNAAGTVLSRPSFNAWGGRRGSNWQGSPSQSEWQAIADTTRRGYTGHEQLDNVMLVHMNGRVYDPAIGRFLSADPFIDGAGTVQGWNRYTYVHNQPLSRTDPSGYASVGGTGKRTQLRDGSKEISAEQELAYGRGSLAWQRQWGNAYSDFGGMAPIWSFSGPGWLQYAVLPSGGEFRGSAAGRWESQWLDRDCPGCGWTGETPEGVEEIGVIGRPSTQIWTRMPGSAAQGLPGSPSSHNPTTSVVNSSAAAIAHYFVGNGQPAELGPSVRSAIISSADQRFRFERIRTGRSENMFQGNYQVNMTWDGAYFVGTTRVDYSTRCHAGSCTTLFTSSVGDGFWDILRNADGPGPRNEIPFGTVYPFVPFSWRESFADPRRDGP